MAGTGTYQIAILGAIGKGLKLLDELDEHLPIVRKEISKAASILVSKGLIERVEKGHFQLTLEGSEFLADGREIKSGPKGPHHCLKKQPANTFRQRAWNAMRLKKRFTSESIILIAKGENDKNPESNLRTYLKNLIAAGYVVLLPKRQAGVAETSNGFLVYRLIKDTGHRAPVWSKGEMIDRNGGDK